MLPSCWTTRFHTLHPQRKRIHGHRKQKLQAGVLLDPPIYYLCALGQVIELLNTLVFSFVNWGGWSLPLRVIMRLKWVWQPCSLLGARDMAFSVACEKRWVLWWQHSPNKRKAGQFLVHLALQLIKTVATCKSIQTPSSGPWTRAELNPGSGFLWPFP